MSVSTLIYPKYYVYRHIRPDTGQPFYIGVGKKYTKNFTIHTSEYRRAFTFDINHRSEYWTRIFEKNDKEIKVEILFESDNEREVLDKEIEFIKLYGRVDNNTGILCNLTDGGEGTQGHIPTEEHRRKISEANKNRIWTPEALANASLSRLGKPGHPMTEEHKQKMSKLHKGKVISEEYRAKISKTLMGRFAGAKNPVSRTIIQLSLNDEFIKEWESIKQASEFYKINNIGAVLAGDQKKCGGFKWKYKE